ncbi:MAG: hypothetical protein KAT17_08730 [Candidatus Aminicenantes bacterium]|nr:hypothetical protein [Candidatus Aminicenantes bacterium]
MPEGGQYSIRKGAFFLLGNPDSIKPVLQNHNSGYTNTPASGTRLKSHSKPPETRQNHEFLTENNLLNLTAARDHHPPALLIDPIRVLENLPAKQQNPTENTLHLHKKDRVLEKAKPNGKRINPISVHEQPDHHNQEIIPHHPPNITPLLLPEIIPPPIAAEDHPVINPTGHPLKHIPHPVTGVKASHPTDHTVPAIIHPINRLTDQTPPPDHHIAVQPGGLLLPAGPGHPIPVRGHHPQDLIPDHDHHQDPLLQDHHHHGPLLRDRHPAQEEENIKPNLFK